MRILGACVT